LSNVFSESSKIYGNGRTFPQKVPYFFIIDFLGENVEIFKEDDIEKSGLLLIFKTFQTQKAP
jgi:hypothetical protein